jgi:hypothetical protein
MDYLILPYSKTDYTLCGSGIFYIACDYLIPCATNQFVSFGREIQDFKIGIVYKNFSDLSRQLSSFLEEKKEKEINNYNVARNKSLKLLPPILTEEFIPHFIRGYFDGDGSIGKYNERIKFSLLGTNDLLIWILNFFKNKGMKTTPKISKKKNIYTFQVNSKSDIELIENILYTSSNDYYLKRKKEKFK